MATSRNTLAASRALCLVLLALSTPPVNSDTGTGDFYHTAILYDVMNEPGDVEIQFGLNIKLTDTDTITIHMPGFTTYGELLGSPPYDATSYKATYDYGDTDFLYTMSTLFSAKFVNGNYDDSTYPQDWMNSTLYLKVKSGREILPDTVYTVTLLKETPFVPLCGMPRISNNPEDFFFWSGVLFRTDSADSTGVSTGVLQSNQVGLGCQELDFCSFNGHCDYCRARCMCFDGYGSQDDLAVVGMRHSSGSVIADCSMRVCPRGKAIFDLPVSATQAHQEAECSNRGICDRGSGQCKCFEGFEGEACEKRACPNGCSGHGRCLSINELAHDDAAVPLREAGDTKEYGASSTTWDGANFQACVCDSGWDVGPAAGQRDLTEWFGPDCSLRRCPGGDDPVTSVVESDCEGKSGNYAPGVTGAEGSICHHECSGRGVCDHKRGVCKCFDGFGGANCGKLQQVVGALNNQ